VLAGSLLAFTWYSWLQAHTPVSFSAAHSYVNPVVAVVLVVGLATSR
jgi:hypothetical protein